MKYKLLYGIRKYTSSVNEISICLPLQHVQTTTNLDHEKMQKKIFQIHIAVVANIPEKLKGVKLSTK